MSLKENNVRFYLLVVGLFSSILFVVAMVNAADKAFTTQSGLKVEMIQEGTGQKPQAGQTVSVHYVGTLQDGKKFDSSRDRGEPISFKLGAGQVIRGWDEGIALLTVGSRAKLTIPPELGYGPRGAGNVIPPNATLMFDVELVGAK
ncbi:MAG: FKBP-type peptidyl-prolyl cis-trans isomerase [Desulfomonile tiedjei]|uniref:Peptidyl-prolyl cis-trans isomerase n=1 Tax=Desulfomonile tiedjei TaxID=2358 RepID=A0A9D6UXC5_9BACT|nr:FKBP-type peptidyl-prolyl cis-trans isomerase [Desulfomonile tiedjei]